MNQYKLLDCGDGFKVEQFGKYKLIRPCPQALWKKQDFKAWDNPSAEFTRDRSEKGTWKNHVKIPDSWEVESENGLKWKIEPNQFGNVGVFTEHWIYAPKLLELFDKKKKVLNLFSYTGSSCLDLVRNGYQVTVVDSSKNAMTHYTEHLSINKLSRENQRLILEDAYKFISREQRRNQVYSSIMIDAPSFGRGAKGEVFNIESDFVKLVLKTKELLAPKGKIVLTLHSPRFTVAILEYLMQDLFPQQSISVEEIINPCESRIGLPSGFLIIVS
jgi:23S rRNA (cytosine1962-C5)-methyltransferase